VGVTKEIQQPVDALAAMVASGRVAVLSGAGLSTESGIPDYRGPSGSAARGTPMTYQAFMGGSEARRRYWARSYVGWRAFVRAVPNDGHHAVTALEREGLLTGIVTQNVDGLHQASGAQAVVDLHGRLSRVICTDCGDTMSRVELDRRLGEANPDFDVRAGEVNPDGDVELSDDDVADFRVVGCAVCGGGTLKPDVVFFGESVPRERVTQCFEMVERASALLVLGSSLTVMSGRRFVLRAAKLGIPVAIVNQGATRGDDAAILTIDAPLGQVLSGVVARLSGPQDEHPSVIGEPVSDAPHGRDERSLAGLRP
jgi:NAD-dependent SIR2 family protein deacetylase